MNHLLNEVHLICGIVFFHLFKFFVSLVVSQLYLFAFAEILLIQILVTSGLSSLKLFSENQFALNLNLMVSFQLLLPEQLLFLTFLVKNEIKVSLLVPLHLEFFLFHI